MPGRKGAYSIGKLHCEKKAGTVLTAFDIFLQRNQTLSLLMFKREEREREDRALPSQTITSAAPLPQLNNTSFVARDLLKPGLESEHMCR